MPVFQGTPAQSGAKVFQGTPVAKEQGGEASKREKVAKDLYSGPAGKVFKAGDALRAGILDIATFGMKDEMAAAVRTVPDMVKGKPAKQAFDTNLKDIQYLENIAIEDNPALYTAGALATGVRGGIGYSKGVGKSVENLTRTGLLPQAQGVLGKGANLATKMGIGGAAAYPAGALYGYGMAEEERVQAAQDTGEFSAILGSVFPLAGAAKNTVGKALNPAIEESKKQVVDLAKKYNIPLGLDDVTDSKFYKTLISEGETLPFSGSSKKIEKQLTAFNKAIAKTIGIDEANLTPEIMDKAYERIGVQFDDLTKGKKFKVSDDVLKDLEEIELVAKDNGFGAEGLNTFKRYADDINKSIDLDGTIDGDRLSKIRASLNSLSRRGSNPDAKALARELENAVVDVIGDEAPEALKKAKYQYKNFLVLEPLAQKDQVEGFISPAQLTNRVRQIYKRDFTRGRAGELGDLARIGQLIKQTIPNSGTPQRTMARNLLTGNLMGAVPTYAFGGPLAAVAQAGLSGAGILTNRALQSRNYNPNIIEGVLQPSIKIGPGATPAAISTGGVLTNK